ncbi:MAG: rhodanese-like domain-containing protein [Saprospiraceae bacterium]
MSNISVHDLKQKIKAGEPFTLVDVREGWEHEAFNIGGQLIPVGELMNRSWELDDHKADEIVVYCRSGSRSGMAQALLQAQGFSKVSNLTGGMLAWQEAFGETQP